MNRKRMQYVLENLANFYTKGLLLLLFYTKKKGYVGFNRPGVAGAVLQTPS